MKAAAGILVLTLVLGVSVFQFAIGDPKGAGKKGVMETSEKAPAQPNKPVKKTDEEWKKELTPEQYRVLRESGTEQAYGEIYKEFKKQGGGTYYCAGCNAELFSSKEKFDSRCGWPSFYDPSKAKNVKSIVDLTAGMIRTEVRCAVCDGHLGHVFTGEGFDTPTDRRYCINGVALKFVPFNLVEKPVPEEGKKPAPAPEGGGTSKTKTPE